MGLFLGRETVRNRTQYNFQFEYVNAEIELIFFTASNPAIESFLVQEILIFSSNLLIQLLDSN